MQGVGCRVQGVGGLGGGNEGVARAEKEAVREAPVTPAPTHHPCFSIEQVMVPRRARI